MSYIPESEMILNQRGAVYHLDLLPEELASTVITVGDHGRVEEVSRYFDKTEHRSMHREFVTHTGYIGKKRLSVVSTGIGTDNIDIVLTELDALMNVDLKTRTVKPELNSLRIVRMGTCGGLQADVPTDAMVISSYGLGLDNLLNFYKHTPDIEEEAMLKAFMDHTALSASMASPYLSRADLSLLNAFKKQGHHTGITVTCPGFYAPQGRQIRAMPAFPQLLDILPGFRFADHRILNFEMETAGIYGLGKILGHACLSISTVVANRAAGTFSTDAGKAVQHMIEKSLEVLMSLP